MTRPEPARRDRVRTVLLVCVVAGVALAVHARVLWYPFIQDDWGYLYRALTIDTLGLLRQELSPFTREIYRPIWPLYFLVVGKVFALNPVFTHVISLTLHVASSLMVVQVLARLTGDIWIGWLSGILYAGASFVHMDPMLWAAGIFESGSVLLALVSISCFLEGHTWLAAIAYAAGLLFKESVAFLPLLFVAIARFDRIPGPWAQMTQRWTIRRWIPICLVMAVYGGIKFAGPSALAFSQDHPYALRLTGPHLLRNVLIYSRWSIGALFPSHLISPVAAAGLLAGLAALLVAGSFTRRRPRGGLDHSPSGGIPLTVWLLGAMSIYLVLPNHLYRYYLTAALPALIGLILLSLRAGAHFLRVPGRAAAVIMIVLVGVSLTSSFLYFRRIALRGLDQPYVEGTNDLVRRGETVVAVHDGLIRAHPTLPRGTLLLLKGVQIWALDQHSAPRLWYGDQTIRVYDAKDLFEESGQWFVRDPAENLGDASTGGVPRRVALAGRPVLLFELTDRGLVERSVISELHRISITRLYDAYFSRAPDRDVLQHWIAQHNAGMSLAAISDAIARSPGFQAAYGTLTNEQFVTLMYRNVLGRDPDLGGFTAWVSRLDRRALTRGEVMLEFLKSGEYRSRSGATSR